LESSFDLGLHKKEAACLGMKFRIINRHGGCAWANGQLDGNAVFDFTLPRPCQGVEVGNFNLNVT
jgi:signal transduction histidine kinase